MIVKWIIVLTITYLSGAGTKVIHDNILGPFSERWQCEGVVNSLEYVNQKVKPLYKTDKNISLIYRGCKPVFVDEVET